MDSTIKNKILEYSALGYAHFNVLLDKKGNPDDYIFYDVNKEFEKISGLSRKIVIGESVKSVIPGIEDSSFDWLFIFSDIANNGGSKEFDQYFRPFNKWIRVYACSVEKGTLTLFFSDITNQITTIESFNKITKLTDSFLDTDNMQEYYNKLSDIILEISEGKFTAFNLYEEDGKHFRTMAISGNKSAISKAMRIIGLKFDKKRWPHDEKRAKKIAAQTITRFSNLHDLTQETMSKTASNILVSTFRLGEVVLIKIIKDKIMIGDFTIIMPKNKLFNRDWVLETLTKQVGLMIDRMRSRKKIKKSEEKFRRVVGSLDAGVVIHSPSGEIIDSNDKAAKLLGLNSENILGKRVDDTIWRFVDENNIPLKISDYPVNLILKTRKPILNKLLGFYNNVEEKIKWFIVNGVPIKDESNNLIQVIINFTEFTSIKESKDMVEKSEEKYRLLTTQMQLGLANHEIICDQNNKPVDYRFLSVNKKFEEIINMKAENVIGKTVLDILPETEPYWIDRYGKVAQTGQPDQFENYSAGLGRYYSVSAYSPKKGQFAVIIDDITESRKRRQEIEYLSYHDQLTGLYNRRYYEQTLIELDENKHYPLSLIMIDINGVKLINDSLGHNLGDLLIRRTAEILKDVTLKSDVVSRIGGDEFVILSPNTDLVKSEKIIEEIQNKVKQEPTEQFIMSLSIGFAIKEDPKESITELFERAENTMYKNKLFKSKDMHHKTLDLIMNILFERNQEEMLHSKRVGALCKKIATQLGLPKDDIEEIKVAGLMHDIGKIGISEKILKTSDKLSDKQWEEIKKHPEIGRKILSKTPEFLNISNYVLEHHERWDGKGYPNELKAEEISLPARIITISDSYDAMTSNRPYRKAMKKTEAIEEIKKCSGTQFDPTIVKVFIEKVLS